METDKATVDFEAQDEGVVAKILVEAGSGDVAVGSPILITVENADDVAAFADYKVDETAAPTPAAASSPEPATPASPPPPPPAAPAAPSPVATAASSGGKVVASPLARMLAQELGYDISSIPGTGPGGRIVAADVKEYQPTAAATTTATEQPAASAPQAATVGPPVVGEGYTDYSVSATSQEVAARLAQSKRNVPHYYLTVDIAVDSLLKLRSTLNAAVESTSSKDSNTSSIGVYELLLKAAALSMKTVPSANASWMGDFVRVYDSVDINVVTGSGDSLSTALLRDCSSKGLKVISTELNAAVPVADDDDSAPPPVDTSLGTFTVVNLGMYGIKSCAPIIREPQACALAIGALENRIVPSEKEDELYKQSIVFTATLSCDHRVVDGAVGAQWLAAFKSHVENPSTLLL